MTRNTMLHTANAMILLAAADKGAGAPAAPAPVAAPVTPAPAPAAPAPAAPEAAKKETKAKAEVLAIRKDIPKPAAAPSKSAYPFDELEVGESFGVKNRDKASFNSIIYQAHTRHSVKVLDANGAEVFEVKDVASKDKNTGAIIKTPTRLNKMLRTREFEAFDVDPTKDEDGASVRIFRNK